MQKKKFDIYNWMASAEEENSLYKPIVPCLMVFSLFAFENLSFLASEVALILRFDLMTRMMTIMRAFKKETRNKDPRLLLKLSEKTA